MAQLPPAVSYIAYDQYILIDANGNQDLFADDGMSLDDFILNNKMVIQADVNTKDGSLDLLPGETDPWAYYDIPTEISRKVIRSLLKILREIDLARACIQDLDIHNVRVSPCGKVKLRDVMIMFNMDSVTRDAQLQLNYQSAADIINHMYAPHDLPPEIEHLCNLMVNNFAVREIFHVHAALVPMTTYPAFFNQLHELAMHEISMQQYRNMLGGLSEASGWRTSVRTSLLLSATLNYKKGLGYMMPINYHNQRSLYSEQLNWLKYFGIPKGNQRVLTQDQLDMINAHLFITFLRNRTAHRMEPLYDLNWIQSNLGFNANSSECVTRVRFPLVCAEIQLWMLANNYHGMLNLDELF